MKMRILPLGVATVLLSAMSLAQEAKAISLNLIPSSSTTAIGEFVGIDVTISDLGNNIAPSVSTFDFDVSFDPSVLSIAGLTFGDPALGDLVDQSGLSLFFTQLGFFSGVGVSVPAPGLVNFFELSLDTPAALDGTQPSAFTLATLNFLSVGVGTSTVGITRINALGDSFGDPLALFSVGSTSIEVMGDSNPPASVPEPGVGLLAIGSLSCLSLLFLKHKKKTELA